MTSTTQRRGLALGILIFASFMDLLDVTIVQVALPVIRDDLGATPAQLEWIVGGYMLAFAVLLVTGGRIGDLIGRQRAFLLGVAGFTLASVAAGLAGTGDILVGARLVQGAFAALMVPQSLATLQALFRPKERAPLYGAIGGVSGLAAVVAPLLGGWLATADIGGVGWRAIFFLNVPVGILIFVLAVLFVPNTRSDRPPRLDLVGVVLLAGALFGMLFPVVEGRALDWPTWLWLPAVAGVGLLASFIAWERRRERRDGSALLPIRLFADRGFSAGLVAQASLQGAMNAFTIAFILYLQASLGFDAFGTGLAMLPFSIGALLGVFAAVPLGTKLGKPVVSVGALVQAGGVAWAIAIMGAAGSHLDGWQLVPPLLLTGFGLGLFVVPLIDVALATVPLADAGAASGVFGTFQQIGAAVGVAISGTVFFTVVGGDWSPSNVFAAMRASGAVAIGGYLLAALASLLLPRRAAVLAHVEEQARLVELDLEPATQAPSSRSTPSAISQTDQIV